jgi:rhodanese-related sulfurtransferase
MKELEKTKRISFSAVIIILVVLIGLLSFNKPKNIFKKDKELTLKPINSQDYIIYPKDLDSSALKKIALIDVRNSFEYNKGHLKNAKNIYTADLLNEPNKTYLNNLENKNKTIVLYGSTPNEASGAWMLITQMGYKNVKLLCAQTNYNNNIFSIRDYPLEKPQYNYAAFMKKAAASNNNKTTKKVIPKKVIKLTKKKKKVAEGGC